MKRSINLMIGFALFLCCFIIASCQKDNNEPLPTNSEISFAIQNTNFKNSQDYLLSDADKIVLTIKSIDGSATKYNSSEIKILQMNGSYYTQKIALKTGDYKLTEFYILDENDSTIFATPYTGSREAQNVDYPLEITFTVTKDITTPVTVEVLSTENKKPEDFGLSHFPIIEVKTFSFMIGVVDSETGEILTAQLAINHNTYDFIQDLDAILNNVVTIKDNIENYTLTIKKIGYSIYSQTFLLDSLKTFANTIDNLPLIIELKKSTLALGLISYWNIDEEEGFTIFDSYSSNHCNVQNGVSINQEGLIGRAASFIETSGGLTTDKNASALGISGNTSKSVSLWIKPDNSINGLNSCGIISLGSSANQEQFGIKYWANPAYWMFDSWNGSVRIGQNDDKLADGIWHHIVVTYASENNLITTYLDGQLITEDSSKILNTGDNYNFSIGIGSQGNFIGLIDEVGLWSKALSNMEIIQLYNNGKGLGYPF